MILQYICQISTIYYHLQLDGVYQKVILNLDLRLAKESLEVRTYACVCVCIGDFKCDQLTLLYTSK